MASAFTQEMEIMVPQKSTVIKLYLSQKEAQTLLIIMNRIGGDPKTSLRKHADSIREALIHVGVTVPSRDVFVDAPSVSVNTIMFKEGTYVG